MSRVRLALGLALLAALAGVLAAARPAQAISGSIVISQVYGGGGNTGASHTHDFIEIYNPGDAPVVLDGMSLQYASATGAGNFGANSGQLTELTGTILPHRYFLVQEGAGAGNGVSLPASDQIDATPIAMSGTAGKVALVTGNLTLGCNGGSTPCDAAALSRIVDRIGYGNANFFEGTGPAPTLSNTTSAQRLDGGCQDTDNNSADFTAVATAPRNSSNSHFCNADSAPFVAATDPANNASEVPTNSNITITFSEPVNVTGGWYSISCSDSGAHTATASGGPATTFTLDPATDFAVAETCTVTVFASGVTDVDENDPPDNMSANHTFGFDTVGHAVRIHEIQDSSHLSPYAGEPVSMVPGVVTAVTSNGFWFQDPEPDASPATSEGLFVFTSSAPAVAVGDAVTVSGRVSEFRPGCAPSCPITSSAFDNLTTTEIINPTVTPAGPGATIAPTVIGMGGRVPPGIVIENDSSANVEDGNTFDPAQDGIDFYESLEAMLVQVNNAVATGPTNGFGEISVVGDNGANAGVRTARGGVVIRTNDFNPERMILDDVLAPTPDVNVRDRFPGAIRAIVDYNFGNFKFLVTSTPTVAGGGLQPEVGFELWHRHMSVATFNVENLDPFDPTTKFVQLASLIVNNLRSPDVIAIEEIQDNNGPANDSTTDASVTWNQLVAAITAAGGPDYDWRDIAPVDDQDGGEPGGNIRVGFLFREDRPVEFVDRPGAGATTPNSVVTDAFGPRLQYSPGRIDPTNSAFANSRKPLAGEFTFDGRRVIVIANHWNSKGGDDPLFGRFQPPVQNTQPQRNAQADVVGDFVEVILAADRRANVVIAGDLNDFEFSSPVARLKAAGMRVMIEKLPQRERYSYVFEGNSQSLDHILISPGLRAHANEHDVVHVNAEFHEQASDHDPQVSTVNPHGPVVPAVAGGALRARQGEGRG